MGLKQKVGLIAGRGELPLEVVREIGRRNAEAVVVGLAGEADPGLKEFGTDYREIPASQLGKIIETFKTKAVNELVFAGKVGKEALFTDGFDAVFQQLLMRLPQKNDDAILLALVEAFEAQGIKVARQTDYLAQLLAPAGSLLGEVTREEMADLQLGFKMAKASGELDIGQSVVVKGGVVLAVEAIEGTDQAIIRGGSLGGPGTVVVKVSKPKQDERFDVPTVGLTTLESMIKARAAVLGIEAGKTFIVDKQHFLEVALQNNLKIISL